MRHLVLHFCKICLKREVYVSKGHKLSQQLACRIQARLTPEPPGEEPDPRRKHINIQQIEIEKDTFRPHESKLMCTLRHLDSWRFEPRLAFLLLIIEMWVYQELEKQNKQKCNEKCSKSRDPFWPYLGEYFVPCLHSRTLLSLWKVSMACTSR